MMTFEDLIDVVRRALADALLAERLHRDPAFREALRDDPDATLRAFSVTTVAGGPWRPRQQRERVRLQVDPATPRPVL